MARTWTVGNMEEFDKLLRDMRKTAREFYAHGKGRTITVKNEPHLDPIRNEQGDIVDAVCYGMDVRIHMSINHTRKT